MNVPVLMVCNDNYIIQTAVTVCSIISFLRSETTISITVLCGDDLGAESRKRLEYMVKKNSCINISFYDVDERMFESVLTTAHIPLCSYYRLIMDEVVIEDKCLFLDGDLIIRGDIADLFEIDLEDNYIAGVKDMGFRKNPDNALAHEAQFGINASCDYINAGVMILNMKKIREDKLREKFLNEMEKGYLYMDQDVLNRVCHGRIKLISPQWNCFHRYTRIQNLGNEDIEEKIVHFAGSYKPWDNLSVRYAELWWENAKRCMDEQEYDAMYRRAKEKQRDTSWDIIVQRSKLAECIIIVGYSNRGMKVYDGLRQSKVNCDIIICDNSIDKIRNSGNDVFLESVEWAMKHRSGSLWIITSQKYGIEIKKQLLSGGIDMSNIVLYIDKTETYLDFIDEKHYVKECLDAVSIKRGHIFCEEEL